MKEMEQLNIVISAEGGVKTDINMSRGNLAFCIGMLLKNLAEATGQSEAFVADDIVRVNKIMAEKEEE